ncbi:MAG: hypothetical protein PHV10_10440 [Sulfuricurvum sp.]|nr:hypothetical protein [Sulfuricurvum sp.]
MKTFLFLCTLPLVGAEYSTSSHWLVDLNSTPEQMRAIQQQFRGFDTAMMEVGYRYEATRKAISEQNFPLASYHWEKIKTAMELGTIRRPARKESAEAFFLRSLHPAFAEVLRSHNAPQIRAMLPTVQSACNACHSDQNVGFIHIE